MFFLLGAFCVCLHKEKERRRGILQKFCCLKLSYHLLMGHSTIIFSFFLLFSGLIIDLYLVAFGADALQAAPDWYGGLVAGQPYL